MPMQSNATQNAHPYIPQMRKTKTNTLTKSTISTNKMLNNIPNTSQQAKPRNLSQQKRRKREESLK